MDLQTCFLAKAIALEFKRNLRRCVRRNCYGCYMNCNHHTDYCQGGELAQINALYSQLVTMCNLQRINDDLHTWGLPPPSLNVRDKCRGDEQFHDLIASYLV